MLDQPRLPGPPSVFVFLKRVFLERVFVKRVFRKRIFLKRAFVKRVFVKSALQVYFSRGYSFKVY